MADVFRNIYSCKQYMKTYVDCFNIINFDSCKLLIQLQGQTFTAYQETLLIW